LIGRDVKIFFRCHVTDLTTASVCGVQVKFPVQRGQSVGGAPQLKLVAPEAMKDVFNVEDVKLPEWPEHM
jgi:hypothetical protein